MALTSRYLCLLGRELRAGTASFPRCDRKSVSSSQTRTMAAKAVREELVPVEDSKRFMMDALMKVGTVKEHAEQLADVLVAADLEGHFSHGMNRLDMYVNDVEVTKTTDPNAKPEVLKESPSTAWVDGKKGIGPVVSNFCMKLAMEKAKTTGVGVVSAKGSNHFGIASYYTKIAAENGFIGMSFTNSSPLMGPTRAKKAALGTNPLSFCAPAKDGDLFKLDMATTAVALGKIELQRRKGEPIPEGWAQDTEGKITTNPETAMKEPCLMPLGGEERNSGYKGFGLSLLVECLCGILADAAYGPCIRRWMSEGNEVADLGHCFIAINPENFAPGFTERLSNLLNFLRTMDPVDPKKPVLVAGDKERAHMKKVQEQGGIPYHENQLKACDALAERLKIDKLKRLSGGKC